MFSDSHMKSSCCASDVTERTLTACHFVDAHFGIAELRIVQMAILDGAFLLRLPSVEKGTESTIFVINSFREFCCLEYSVDGEVGRVIYEREFKIALIARVRGWWLFCASVPCCHF